MLIWIYELIYTSSLGIYLIFMNNSFVFCFIFLDILVLNDVFWILINFVKTKQYSGKSLFPFFFFRRCKCGRVALIKDMCSFLLSGFQYVWISILFFYFLMILFALLSNKSINLLWSKSQYRDEKKEEFSENIHSSYKLSLNIGKRH